MLIAIAKHIIPELHGVAYKECILFLYWNQYTYVGALKHVCISVLCVLYLRNFNRNFEYQYLEDFF